MSKNKTRSTSDNNKFILNYSNYLRNNESNQGFYNNIKKIMMCSSSSKKMQIKINGNSLSKIKKSKLVFIFLITIVFNIFGYTHGLIQQQQERRQQREEYNIQNGKSYLFLFCIGAIKL